MEHLSRRAASPVDHLLIVSDVTRAGLKAAGRISALSDELNISTFGKGLILNRADDGMIETFSSLIEETGLDVIGTLPQDPILERYQCDGGSLLEVASESIALEAVRELALNLRLC